MKYGTVNGVSKRLSRVLLGATSLDSDDIPKSFAILDHAFSLGVTGLETARRYGKGRNEALMGRWIAERKIRDQIVVVTKGGFPEGGQSRLDAVEITKDLEESLAQLGVEQIDLYLLHKDDPARPVEPIVDVLDQHVASGKIAAFGASNWSCERIAAANAYAARAGLTPMAAASPHFSVVEPTEASRASQKMETLSGEAGRSSRAWYAANQLAVLAYGTLGQGFLSGRFRADNLGSFTSPMDRYIASTFGTERNFAILARAEEVGKRLGITAAQVALAYVLSQPMNLFVALGTSNIERLAANVAASSLELAPADCRYLES